MRRPTLDRPEPVKPGNRPLRVTGERCGVGRPRAGAPFGVTAGNVRFRSARTNRRILDELALAPRLVGRLRGMQSSDGSRPARDTSRVNHRVAKLRGTLTCRFGSDTSRREGSAIGPPPRQAMLRAYRALEPVNGTTNYRSLREAEAHSIGRGRSRRLRVSRSHSAGPTPLGASADRRRPPCHYRRGPRGVMVDQ
jgi:hypothetical protein